MARTIQHILFGSLLLIGAVPVNAQDGLLKRGDHYYNNFSFAPAIEAYEQAFRRDASSIPHARRLAESYWNLRDAKNAERWYAIVAASSKATPVDLYRYAELLRVSGQYADSEIWMKRFSRMSPEDSRVHKKDNATERLGELLGDPGLTHKVIRMDLNSDASDMSPFIHKSTLYFASARADQFTSRRTHSWNNQPFLNIYTGTIGKDGSVINIKTMGADMNTEYHESNAIISNDGSELYFTRNNYSEGRKVLSEDGVNNLQIFVRRMLPDGWSKEAPFPHNSASYSVGHPALNKDGSRIYFTSDKPGGMGGKDIYVCQRGSDGSWGEPENLGPMINTEGDEMFPYVFDDQLYFASDGHLGLGGLDIFRASIRATNFGIVSNLNAPINSSADDFGICMNETGELAIFTSDRDGALAAENLYMFRMHSKAAEDRIWAGRVLDVNDARPIPYLPIRLLDKDRKELATTTTSEFGAYEFPAPSGLAFISVRIPGGPLNEIPLNEIESSQFGNTELPDLYMNSVMDLPINAILRDANTDEWLSGVSVTIKDTRDHSVLFFGITDENGITQGQIPDRRYGDDVNFEVTFVRTGYLSKTIQVDFRVLMFLEQALTGPEGVAMTPALTGIDIGLAMNLRPIYFDYREARIRSDAAGELDLVAEVMRQDLSIRIELRSHTDSRASAEYNDQLSQRRANSTREYLIQQGIAADRVMAKGMGERKLVNLCTDGVECSEEEHQMNRRTEFIITEVKEASADLAPRKK